MAKKKKTDIKVGDIVKVIDDSLGDAFGCTGEVIEIGPPIKVVMVLRLSLKRDQIEKKVDLAGLSWNALRKLAKKVNIPAKGKRFELEAKFKEYLLEDGRVEVPESAEPAADVTAAPSPIADEMASDSFEISRASVQSFDEDVAARGVKAEGRIIPPSKLKSLTRGAHIVILGGGTFKEDKHATFISASDKSFKTRVAMIPPNQNCQNKTLPLSERIIEGDGDAPCPLQ